MSFNICRFFQQIRSKEKLMRLVSPSPHHAGLQAAMTIIKLFFASHPSVAEHVECEALCGSRS